MRDEAGRLVQSMVPLRDLSQARPARGCGSRACELKVYGGNTLAYQYAMIYAQWGNRAKALEWLETALRLRDPGLVYLKTDPLMDPLRKEPRFQAVMRELKF